MAERINYVLYQPVEERPAKRRPETFSETIGGLAVNFVLFEGLFSGMAPHGVESTTTIGSNVDPTSYGHTLEALGVTNNIAGQPDRRH